VSLDVAVRVAVSHIYLESHGVKLDVEIEDDALRAAVEAILPPDWAPTDRFPEHGHLKLATGSDGSYGLIIDDILVAGDLSAEVGVHALDSQIRALIALNAPDRIFIHAGVVGVNGRGVVLPAPSFAGKSSLVAALVAEGASYYSDEFAVLDSEGRVHPYPRPLSIRREGARYGEKTPLESMAAGVGDSSLRASLIAITRYVPGEHWSPRRQSSGAGAMALLANAIPARSRPEETMRTVNRAAANTVVLEGPRGDATETAELLLSEMTRPRH
jgi:hypothetical protein